MARGDFPSSKQDQFVLRFPDGLRDRIKASAEKHGRSMNAEIILVLEKEFPEPWPLNSRVQHLVDLLTAIRKVRGYDQAIDVLTAELLETVEGIASGRVPDVDEQTKLKVRESLDNWLQARAEEEDDRLQWRPSEDETQP
ncbi:Arc family DNA-binding protein [Corticibacterium sp. UT-5YL-CI-8]|nr:Arc family DNA-binding protein [Tianweitania sp. UT-5YL-CI-8]